MLKRMVIYGMFLSLFLTVKLAAQIKCKIEHYSTEDGLSDDGVMSIKDHDGFMYGAMLSLYEDNSGLLWIEPDKHGVIKYNSVRTFIQVFFLGELCEFL